MHTTNYLIYVWPRLPCITGRASILHMRSTQALKDTEQQQPKEEKKQRRAQADQGKIRTKHTWSDSQVCDCLHNFTFVWPHNWTSLRTCRSNISKMKPQSLLGGIFCGEILFLPESRHSLDTQAHQSPTHTLTHACRPSSGGKK